MITQDSPERPFSPGYDDFDSFDVNAAVTRIVDSVVKHWILILVTVLLCLGLVYTYIKLFPPVFRAEVMMQAEAEDDEAREEFYGVWNLFRKSELNSEVELMTSTPVVKRVVQDLDLTFDDVYHSPLTQLVYLWEQSTIGNWYRSIKAWIFPPPESPFMPSPEDVALARTVTSFKDGAWLEPVPDSTIGYLTVRGPSYRVAEYANKLADTYAEYRQQSYSTEAEIAYQSLADEVARGMEERDQVLQARLEFEVEHGLALGLAKDKAVMENWAELAVMIQALEFKESKLEASHKAVSELLAAEPPTLTSSSMESRNPIRDSIRDSVLQLRKNLNAARLIYRPDAPEIRDIERQLAELEAQLPNEPTMVDSASDRGRSMQYEQLRASKQEFEVELASVRAELSTMRRAQEQNEIQVAKIPALEHEYMKLQRDQEMVLSKLTLLRERLMQADVSRITAKSAPPSLQVIEYAAPPEKPSWPNTKLLYLVAVMLGGFGGIGLAILVEMMNNKATLAKLMTRNDLPVYASVEVFQRSGRLSRAFRNQEDQTPQFNSALERLKGPVTILEHHQDTDS